MTRTEVFLAALVPASTVLLGLAGEPIGEQRRDDAQGTEMHRPKALSGLHLETPHDPWIPGPKRIALNDSPYPPARSVWARGPYQSVQVNVDEHGQNIPGDAANEPSIAIDPRDPSRIVIGWRQFDTVESNFRQAGYAFSHDGGRTWTFPGALDPGVFRSDPVLAGGPDGRFYYYSLTYIISDYVCDLFISEDGGRTWGEPIRAFGGDKAWITIDQTSGVGRGNIYAVWTDVDHFTRSTNGGRTFMDPIPTPLNTHVWGTLSVGPDGELHIVDAFFDVAKSLNVQAPDQWPAFSPKVSTGLGYVCYGGTPNPDGLLGQAWIATDHSGSPSRGNVYVLGSDCSPETDPVDVRFARSSDGGLTWSDPVRVNDDPLDSREWQWFGTMSVAPNGRIDAIWNDTREPGSISARHSELYYAFSVDQGQTWSENVPVSPVFDSHVGWPNQSKIGDYYHTISDNAGVHVAYAATFNGEQDVYYLRIGMRDCNENGTDDGVDVVSGGSADCDHNEVPDECQRDCNNTGVPDGCDLDAGVGEDCDGNDNPDECDPDFDDDDVPDACDPDIDNDGISNDLDICDFTPADIPVTAEGNPMGDHDLDCAVALPDYLYFSFCLNRGGPGRTDSVAFCRAPFDFDGDKDVDLADFVGFQAVFSLLNP